MSIFVIRHGETASNAAQIVQLPNVPLSPRGVEQAAHLARRLALKGVERIVASDLRRAAMTAESLHQATAAPLHFESLLQERNFGDLRGTPYAELEFDLFGRDLDPPGGETWEVFHARVDRAWACVRDLSTSTQGNLAVVTHGLVCRSLVERHLTVAAGDDAALSRPWRNTCLTVVEACPPFRIELLNCTAHLEGLSDAGGVA